MADAVGLLGLEDLAGRAGLRVVALASFGFFFAGRSLRAATFFGADFFAGLLEEVNFFAIFLGADFLVERAINVIGGAAFLSRPEFGEA